MNNILFYFSYLLYTTGTKVRLAGSGVSYKGRLEILLYYSYGNRQWGPVCKYGFSDIDARVFCNQLGFG